MPKLLDYTALGQRETGRTGRPSATADLSAEKSAIAGIGNSIARVGDVVGSIADKQQADDTRIATSNATANLLKEQNAFEQRMREEPDNWQNHEKEYEAHITRARQNSAALITDPRQRKLWEAQNQTTMEGWRQRVQSTVRSRHNDAFLSQTQTDVNEIRNLALDPNTPEEERALHIQAAGDMIEDARRRGVINDQQAGEWAKRWREGYAVTKLEMMPARERAVSLAGVRHATPQLGSAIAASAQRLGIDPVDLGTVISYETGGTFDPWKAGPTTQWGQHRGLIQWGEPQRKKYGVYEGMPVEEQLKAVEAYLKDAGVKPGMGLLDVYSAINAGRVGRHNASDAGNGGAPGTVADKVNNQMAGHRRKAAALLGGKSVDPIADMVPPDQRQKLEQRAQFEIDRDRRQETASVSALIVDDLSSIQNTGKPIADLTQGRVAEALGEENAVKWARQRQSAQTVFDTTAEFPELTNDQISQRLEKIRPKGGEEGFKEQQATYDAINKVATKVLKERDDDPALSVSRLPAVTQAQAALREGGESPQGWQALGKARLQAQAAIGIPEAARSPITVAESRRIMTPVTEAQEGEQIKALREVATQMDQLFGLLAPAAFAAAINSVSVDKETARAAAPILRRLVQGQKVPDQEMAAFQAAMQDQTMYRSVAPLASDYDPFKASPGGGPMFGPASEQEPAAPPQTRIIPPSAIKELRLNPQSAEAFMQKYGKDDYGRGVALKVMETLGLKPQQKRAP